MVVTESFSDRPHPSDDGALRGTSVHLVFPGVTEARLFPYLSLPMLAGYLRAHGIRTVQHDVNIDLTHHLLTRGSVEKLLEREGLSTLQRRTLEFAHGRADDILAAACGGKGGDLPWEVAFRLANHVIGIATSQSLLTRSVGCLTELGDNVGASAPPLDVVTAGHDDAVTRLLSTVRDDEAAVVGISVAFFSQLRAALRIARMVKERHPDALVVLGGQQVSMRAQQLARVPGIFDDVDALAPGQGEACLRDVVGRLERGMPPLVVPSLVTGRGTAPGLPPTHSITRNPPPDFRGLDMQRYLMSEVQVPLITCVGCYWGRCTFCSYGNRGRGADYQQLTVELLTSHITSVLDATGSDFIAFVDENCNLRLVLKAVEAARQAGYEFRYSTRNRLEASLADDDFVARLAASGCSLMSVGYETNSQRLLDSIDKGVDAALYSTIVHTLHDHGIILRVSVMGGLPEETEEEAAASRRFLVEHSQLLGVDAMQMLIVEPTSVLAGESGTTEPTGSLDPLTNNAGFSYLGGRHGTQATYEGASVDERRTWLRETMTSIHPGKNDERHPRWRAAHPSAPTDLLALHPWVVVDSDDSLIDLRWEMRYRIARRAVAVRLDGDRLSLRACTAQGRELLGLLGDAGVGEAS